MNRKILVVIIAGPAGAGKTTVARRLASELGWAFLEGDTFHPAGNLEKMASGRALDDRDRDPWLQGVARAIEEAILLERPTVIACSALKNQYRHTLIGDREGIEFVFLKADPALLRERLRGRFSHFFREGLLESQLAILEEPARALVIDASPTPGEIVEQIRARIGHMLS